MKCVLCGKTLRGAGSMLLDKPCACLRCVDTYNNLDEAAKSGDYDAAELVELAKCKIDSYKPPVTLTKLEKDISYATASWRDTKKCACEGRSN